MTDEEVQQLQARLRRKIEQELHANRYQETAKLAALADRVATLRVDAQVIDRELRRIAAQIQGASPAAAVGQMPIRRSPAARDSLIVRLEWRNDGYPYDAETIAETTVAATLLRFLERVSEVVGQDGLASLHQIRTGRGPLISRDPGADFLNRVDGSLYSNKPIGRTGWHVLTQSATVEKKHQIEEALSLLGLRSSTVELVPGAATPRVVTAPATEDDATI